MKNSEEIYEDALKYDRLPDNYNTLEINCYMNLKRLLGMYFNKQISKENASAEKNKIFKRYELDKKQLEFKIEMYDEHIEKINKTQALRCVLRKQLKENDKDSLATALRLLELYSGEEWKYETRDEGLSERSS